MSDDLTPVGELVTFDVESPIEVRDAAKREITMRVVPWNVVAESKRGPEEFKRGAFAGIDPSSVVLRLGHQDPPAGHGISLEEREDGAYMDFKVSKTQRGDDILALAQDGVTRFVSPGFYDVPGGTEIQTRNGRRTHVVSRALLVEASTTWRPTWQQSAVLQVRSTEGEGQMADEPKEAAVVAAPPSVDITPITSKLDAFTEKVVGRMEALEERMRSQIDIPALKKAAPMTMGQWTQTVLRGLAGDKVPELQTRDWADLVTGDNLGVVPEAFSSEIIGVIDAARPFLASTRRLPTPASGLTLNMPVITTRPTVGVQVNEKDPIASTASEITSTSFDAITIAGGGDISLQLLKRSDPSFLDLYLRLLAEAMSENAESEAISALLGSGVSGGTGTIDPEALAIGEAWTNAQGVHQRADTMWLSSDAVAAFIDAKADGTNMPLYGAFNGGFSVTGGNGGTIMGLRTVYVPALDGSGSDVVIGPANGFAWAEDGSYTLQVDVPSKAGRDVALVSMFWFAPLYPDAFTEWSLGG